MRNGHLCVECVASDGDDGDDYVMCVCVFVCVRQGNQYEPNTHTHREKERKKCCDTWDNIPCSIKKWKWKWSTFLLSLCWGTQQHNVCVCVDYKRRFKLRHHQSTRPRLCIRRVYMRWWEKKKKKKKERHLLFTTSSVLSVSTRGGGGGRGGYFSFFSLSKITKFKRKRKRNGMNILMQVFQRFLVVVVTLVLLLFLLFFFFEGNRMAISWYGAKKRVIFLTLNSILGGSHTLVRPSVRPSVCVYGPSSESTAHCRVSEWETRKREKEMDEARFDY